MNDNEKRKSTEIAKPVICYEYKSLPEYDDDYYKKIKTSANKTYDLIIPPRDGLAFKVKKGQLFKIISIEGPQVGDLNIWNYNDLSEHFYSGKTRQLHASHLTTSHRLWSNMPSLRPLATIIDDSLNWYGFDEDGAGVHDVIGTRCDPYTNHMLKGVDYNHCCHSNLVRAFSNYKNLPLNEAEKYVHDVFNIFMCTGFTKDTHQYFMKKSPVKPGDYIEFYAEMNLLCALSTCPGGDCSKSHSDDNTKCYPLKVEIYKTDEGLTKQHKTFAKSAYAGNHGV